MNEMKWRTHNERPATDEPITALIAVSDEPDGAYLADMLYVWRAGRWVSEDTGAPIRCTAYWWIPESELLAALPGPVSAS